MLKGHDTERKTFETKMKAEYKLKKERWKREMDNQETPKSQRNQGTLFKLMIDMNGSFSKILTCRKCFLPIIFYNILLFCVCCYVVTYFLYNFN